MPPWGVLQRDGFRRACDVVAGTEEALTDALGEILAYPDQNAAWRFSTLTCSGSPVELAFTTYDADVRYTVEFGGPDVRPADRLTNIGQFLGSRGADELSPILGEWQRTSTPEWGAWLGIRRGPTYKVYAEMPAGAESEPGWYGDYLDPVPLPARWLMTGQQPGSTRREFYFECATRGLPADDLERLLAHAGLAHRQPELTDLMCACVFGGAQQLPEVKYGFSYSVLPGAQQPAVSVFAYAADFIGGDGFVRHQLLSVAYARGWQLSSYPELSAPLGQQFTRAMYHNTIGFVVTNARELGLHVSMSPPPPTE